jgi:transcriptional regulator with XRE-family HTH domain
MSVISENIKNLRISNKMTQGDLAKRLNLTISAISAYENGSRKPSQEVLIKLARVFHVSTDNLLGFSKTYTIDVSKLTTKQRNTLQELADIFPFTMSS